MTLLLLWAITLPIVLIGILIAVAATIDRARSVDPAAVKQLASRQDDLRLLYRRTNIKGVCTQSPPVLSNAHDIIALQTYAKLLAHFYHLPLHLREPIFDVTFARQAEGVGGHVDWTGATRVKPVIFIEVDPRLRNDPNATMCVLAHEFSHVVLENARCNKPELIENERLVDLYALWSGFGPLMLRYKKGSVVLGYLSPHEIACLIALREEIVGPWAFEYGRDQAFMADGRRIIKTQRRCLGDGLPRGQFVCHICGQVNRIRIKASTTGGGTAARCGLCGMSLGQS